MALKLSVSLSTDRSTDRVNSAKRFPMGRVWNSAERSLRVAFGTQQNALYGSRLELSRTLSYGSRLELSRTLSYGSRLELSRTLSYGSRLELSRTLSTDRVWNSAERSLRIAFGTQQNALYGSRSRLKLKAKYHITFLSYNLLTEAENAAGFIQAFLL
ncbi:hypothetical protein [Leptospira interrogans]|uniref:hypothetical protein n=1 Tax=Leptospira interrogans TaxID=173 RepID=UPI0021587729|nr:hypothetical protein [Leptospira interrogans]WOT12362.1 hypothetical protein CFY92_0007905 [Leptospira interrogans]